MFCRIFYIFFVTAITYGPLQQHQQDALFAFSLLRLIASTCFQHLFAHHQEVLYIQQLVYFVHIMLAGCWQSWSGTGFCSC
jgi:hypothetical protein